ncbi:MAG: hypothetical protein QNJ05_12835 [Woeseiaceae bacterium]|nr:hypothetical protein [Woeseiaceae bacterium]
MWVLLLALCVSGCSSSPSQSPVEDYDWIAARIFLNETGGDPDKLVHWNVGEDFPSLGIGHFIWFPTGVDAPFDESFPAMAGFVIERSAQCAPAPEWLTKLSPFDAPWPDRATFEEQTGEAQVLSLREWLNATMPLQAQYIVESFERRWSALELPDKAELDARLQRLLATPEGTYAVTDYINFKGIGTNPRERYAGAGWGLIQVLRDADDDTDIVVAFSRAAAGRLRQRVALSPPERNEVRWLPGWERRVFAYAEPAETTLSLPGVSPCSRQ